MKLIFSPHPNSIHPFWQGNDVGTQYRSGIYFYTPEQEKAALESKDRHQKLLNRTIVTEILPAKKFYRAEDYHQQYLERVADLVLSNLLIKAATIRYDAMVKFCIVTSCDLKLTLFVFCFLGID